MDALTAALLSEGWTEIPVEGYRGDARLFASAEAGLLALEVVPSSPAALGTLLDAFASLEGRWKSLWVVLVSDGPSPGLRPRPGVRLSWVDRTAAAVEGDAPALVGRALREPALGARLGRLRASRADFLERLATVKPWGTWVILAACVLMFGVTQALGGGEVAALRLGANQPLLVKDGQWWRLWGATFLHFGFVHLAVNMWALYQVGPFCERVYGNARFLALYALAGLCGSLTSVWWGAPLSAGASGALFGLFGATAIVAWRMREEMPARLRSALLAGMVPVIGYNLLLGVAVNQAHWGVRIDNAAHLGGLAGGALFGLLLASARARWVTVACWIVAAAYFANEMSVAARPLVMPVATFSGSGMRFDYPAAMRVVPVEGGLVVGLEGAVVQIRSGAEVNVGLAAALRSSGSMPRREGPWTILEGAVQGEPVLVAYGGGYEVMAAWQSAASEPVARQAFDAVIRSLSPLKP